jgi:competence protein ComEC
VPKLRQVGVKALDLLVISHPHADHLGGADAVLESLPVRNFLDNGVPHTTRSYRRVMDLVERKDVRYLRAEPREIRLGDAVLQIVPAPSATREHENLNNQSVAVVVRSGNFRAVLAGDSEVEEINGWLDAGAIPRAQVLKASHHGSRNGVTPRWLAAIRPETVVLQLAADNRYGHPHPRAIRYYAAGGRQILRTDRHGDVVIQIRGDGSYRVSCQRGGC